MYKLMCQVTSRVSFGFSYLIVAVALLSLLSSGCGIKSVSSVTPTPTEGSEISGTLLLYTEMDASEQESAVRILVTESLLRIDAGPADQNYVLYDRAKKIFFRIDEVRQTVTVNQVVSHSMTAGFPIHWQVESQTSHAVMRQSVGDSALATHYQFKLNEQDCYDVVTVESVYQDVLDGMREYRQASAEQAKEHYVQGAHSQCQDAVEIFDPDVYLKYGLPIREWSAYGLSRFLVNYRPQLIFPADLFQLPENFQQIIQP